MIRPKRVEPLILALDFPDTVKLRALVERLEPGHCRLKIGKEVFTREGPNLVRDLTHRGFDVFLDLKFHDIPHTVARAVAAATDLGVWMVNVHASGGRRMMEAAARECAERSAAPLLIGVTVLTSMTAEDLTEVGCSASPADQVLRLAGLAQASGLDGVVCSAQEAATLRRSLGAGMQLVTPGIRPAGATHDDQRRIMTPGEALRAGATHLVVGRPVTQAEDPLAALQSIYRELEEFAE